jgi:ribosomal protein L35
LATRKTHKNTRQLRGTVVLASGMVKRITKALAGNSY